MESLLVIVVLVWLPVMVGAPFIIIVAARARPHRPEEKTCVYCGYDRRGDQSYLCPECGRPHPHPWHPKAFVDRQIVRLLQASAGVLALAAATHFYCGWLTRHHRAPLPIGTAILLPALMLMAGFLFAHQSLQQARARGSSATALPVILMLISWAGLIGLTFILVGRIMP